MNQKPDEHSQQPNIYWLSETGDLNEIARNLFDLLQKLDTQGFKKICIEQVPAEEGLGVAINDRLARAAAKSFTP